MKYILCPICKGHLIKQARFEKVSEEWRKKHGEPQPREFKRSVIGITGKTERVKEKPQLNGEKRYSRYYCKNCKIGWRYADAIKWEIKPATENKLTAKQYKKLLSI